MSQDFFQLPEEEMRKNWRKALDKALKIGLDTFKVYYIANLASDVLASDANPKLFAAKKEDSRKKGVQFPFDLFPKSGGIVEFTGEFNKQAKEILAGISPANNLWVVGLYIYSRKRKEYIRLGDSGCFTLENFSI